MHAGLHMVAADIKRFVDHVEQLNNAVLQHLPMDQDNRRAFQDLMVKTVTEKDQLVSNFEALQNAECGILVTHDITPLPFKS